MPVITRRAFLEMAAAMGATAAWTDPHVVATTVAALSADSDWTCRVLVAGLQPSRIYWYRFATSEGFGSRIGRVDDPRPARFAFVSCQNANQGAQNAYRRIIFEDQRAPEAERLGFVLHLGDFIYEIVWYPEDRSEDPTGRAEAKPLSSEPFPDFIPGQAIEILDAGRTYNGGHPPDSLKFGSVEIANFCKDRPAQTILGAEQKAWFLECLRNSQATWKIWGNTTATLDMRADPQNLPQEFSNPWPGAGYAAYPGGDHSTAYFERGEIYDFVQAHGITGFATVAGDRHSFWAGLAAKSLPPKPFEPVGVAFVTGSISAPGLVEALEHVLPADLPLRALYVGQATSDHSPQPTVNMLLHHGVRSCLEYAKTGDIAAARAKSNPEFAPHLSFVDLGGHGYAVVRASTDAIETEFVCIPRPLERSDRPDGGPLAYRARFRAPLWPRGKTPKLEMQILEGDPKFSV